MTKKKYQRIFGVEKFIPTQCPQPGCRNKFARYGDGDGGFYIGTYFLHESREITREIFNSIRCPGVATDLIICGKCKAATLRVKIEDRQCARRKDAEAALKEGFVNLKLGRRLGERIKRVIISRYLDASRPTTELFRVTRAGTERIN